MKTVLRRIRQGLFYLTFALGMLVGSLASWELAAQTWNFGGPVSYVTTTNGRRAMAVTWMDTDGNALEPAATDGSGQAIVVGPEATGEPAAGEQPLLTGAKGSNAVPTVAGADGDATDDWNDQVGARHVQTTASTVTNVSVGDAAVTTQVLGASSTRVDYVCTNRSTAAMYVRYGAAAVIATATEIVAPNGQFYPRLAAVRSAVNAIWASDAGGTVECDVFSNQ